MNEHNLLRRSRRETLTPYDSICRYVTKAEAFAHTYTHIILIIYVCVDNMLFLLHAVNTFHDYALFAGVVNSQPNPRSWAFVLHFRSSSLVKFANGRAASNHKAMTHTQMTVEYNIGSRTPLHSIPLPCSANHFPLSYFLMIWKAYAHYALTWKNRNVKFPVFVVVIIMITETLGYSSTEDSKIPLTLFLLFICFHVCHAAVICTFWVTSHWQRSRTSFTAFEPKCLTSNIHMSICCFGQADHIEWTNRNGG